MVDDIGAGAIRRLLPLRQVRKLIAIGFDPLTGFEARNGIVPPRSFYSKIPPTYLDPCTVRWSAVDLIPFRHLETCFHFFGDQFPSSGARYPIHTSLPRSIKLPSTTPGVVPARRSM
jgi:hypothetical protein